MIKKFAADISHLLELYSSLDNISVKTAGDVCTELQETAAKSAITIYDVIEKKATEDIVASSIPVKVTTLIEKMAETLHKPKISNETLLKIAGVVLTDNALSSALKDEAIKGEERTKLAMLRAYGREFFCSLLHEVI